MIRHAKRLIIFVLGLSVLLIGIAMIFLPGPAFIVIPAGLAILATEFMWARWLLKRIKQQILGERSESTPTSTPETLDKSAPSP